MPWKDAQRYEADLGKSLNDFNWAKAADVCDELIARLPKEPELLPEVTAKSLMYSLRRKRQYSLMTRLAEALLQSGLRTQQIRRQYAQALIDQGIFAAAEMVLQSIIQEPQGVKVEELEARGLTGRIYKQLYVNINDPHSVRIRAYLERALNEYLFVYRLNPGAHLWHGINVVALAARARRDNLPLTGLPDSVALAQEILATLTDREQQSAEPLKAWDLATVLEAHVALSNEDEAAIAAARYVEAIDLDAFEINSTIRQLTEVWQLDESKSVGRYVLPICKAAHLRKESSAQFTTPQGVKKESDSLEDAMEGLELIFGDDRMLPLKWYKKGLDQCNSVARVERKVGKGSGTGWLVQANDFFPGRTGVLLLTNNHVISSTGPIRTDECEVHFQAMNETLEVEDEIVWQSPVGELDATFVKLKGVPKAPPLILHKRAIEMADPKPRLYIMGHPGGRGIEFSLQDNHLIGTNGTLIHYRTPTEPGSSGSPVFESEDWRVVALHHKGLEQMKRLDGTDGTYQANEGVSILAIQTETKKVDAG